MIIITIIVLLVLVLLLVLVVVTVRIKQHYNLTEHFGGPRRAVGWLYVFVCLFVSGQ